MRPPAPPAHRPSRRRSERGAALVVTVVFVLLVVAFASSLGSTVTAEWREISAAQGRLRQLHLADSGLDAAIQDIDLGGTGALGSSFAPVVFGHGEFWTTVTDHGDGTLTILSHGRYGEGVRAVRCEARRGSRVFDHAVFAGNSSGDPDYVMEFGGVGVQADDIQGNVYSGGAIDVVGEAAVTGDATALGTITGITGDTGVTRAGFDFEGVTLSGPDIVDVAAAFSAGATRVTDDAGGEADQLPDTNTAHIFRKNPSDRTTELGETAKDDYFLEDPYETVTADSAADGSDPYDITIDDGTGLSRVAYYIDGNLWIHNTTALSFRIATTTETGTQVTFLVRGNIYFSDSVRVENPAMDGVAFVAVKDPDVSDSGNIYLGDPRYGTLKEMQGYLYAENDFYDLNLDETGSRAVTIRGAMTAGNRVLIERDSTTEGNTAHSKLEVVWDPRMRSGVLDMPFLSAAASSAAPVSPEIWLEVSPEVP